MSLPRLFLILNVALIACVGCGGSGDELNRQAVSGKVTLGGQPLQTGTVQFMPTGPDATPAAGILNNGEYRIDAEMGLVPGTYKVIISSSGAASTSGGADEPAGLPGDSLNPPPDIVPAKYNAESILTVEIKEGENIHNFELEK